MMKDITNAIQKQTVLKYALLFGTSVGCFMTPFMKSVPYIAKNKDNRHITISKTSIKLSLVNYSS